MPGSYKDYLFSTIKYYALTGEDLDRIEDLNKLVNIYINIMELARVEIKAVKQDIASQQQTIADIKAVEDLPEDQRCMQLKLANKALFELLSKKTHAENLLKSMRARTLDVSGKNFMNLKGLTRHNAVTGEVVRDKSGNSVYEKKPYTTDDLKILITIVSRTVTLLAYCTARDTYGKSKNNTFMHSPPNGQSSQTAEEHQFNLKQFGLLAFKLDGVVNRPNLKAFAEGVLYLSITALIISGALALTVFTGGAGFLPMATITTYLGLGLAPMFAGLTGLHIGYATAITFAAPASILVGASIGIRFGFAPGRGEAGHASRLAQNSQSRDLTVLEQNTTDTRLSLSDPF